MPRTKWMMTMTLSRHSLCLKRNRRNGGKAGPLLIGHGVRFQRGCLRTTQPVATRVLIQFVSPIRWCRVDKNRFLVGDIAGRLAMLIFTPPSGLTLLPLGEVSSLSAISGFWLTPRCRLPPHRVSPTLPLKWCMLDLTWRTRC